MKGMKKKLVGMGLALALIISVVAIVIPKGTTEASGGQSYTSTVAGQQSDIQDGVTLHCWNWSYKNIEANMELIAEQGFTAIQTSPIQQAKEGTSGRAVGSNWWVYYQPMGFHIDNTGTSALGTKAEFESMCAKAHEYGIKVIVDVVANHLGNQTGNNLANTIVDDIKNDSSCWHNIYVNTSNYSSRYDITQYCMGGLPDLNTGSDKIQNYVLSFLKECIDSGADGFRFDAAKHIETPEDSKYNCGSDFWPTVIYGATEYAENTRGIDLYCYGEILDQPDSSGNLSVSAYTQYMSITDNQQGNNLRSYITSGNATGAASSYYYKDATADKLVLWAESHDTYADGSSMNVSVQNINKTWALVAARADAMGLYLARPYSTSSLLGAGDVTGWAYTEVGVVNRFHNAFVGTTEYMSSENGIAYCERGDSGVVLVNCNGTNTSVNVTAHTMKNGTYVDQITGSTFTVSNGRICGNIGSTGIAVVYNVAKEPAVIISQEGGSFTSDTLTLTVTLSNADSGTYQIGNNAVVSFTKSAQFTIGNDMSYGDSVSVQVTATASGETSIKNYTFTKVEKSNNVAYIELPSGWGSTVYCYAYDSASESVNNGAWPGVAMTYVSDGIYMYEIPENIAEPRVIFYSSDSCRYPGDMEPGLLVTGSMIYQNGTWKTYQPVEVTYGKVVVEYVDINGNTIADSTTLEGKTGTSYTTSAKAISGYTYSKTIGNATGTYTDGTITVQYVYAVKEVVAGATAYIKLPSGWSSTVYCYVYSADGATNNGAWPGVAMTKVSDGIYKYEVPSSITNPLVIFTDGNNQYPGSMQPGLSLSEDMIYADGTWKAYEEVVITYGKVVVSYVDANGAAIADSVTLEGQTGTSYATSAKTISGYTYSKTVGNASGTYTDGTITVQYVYTVNQVVTGSTAYIKLPSGWGSTVYCYAYSADDESSNAAWPGVAMTYVSNGIYKYEVPSNISNPLVIFTDGNNQYPGSMQPGLSLSGDMIYADGTWKTYSEEVVTGNVAYIEKESWWGSTLYCYAYSADDDTSNGSWPGVKMTYVSGNIYKYEVPSNITNPLVIFTDGNNQYPGSMQPGLSLSGSMIYQGGSWKAY